MRIELTRKQKERFWDKVSQTDGCWNWQAGKTKAGYGKLTLNNKDYLAHRISYFIANGSIPDDKCVLHKCDNPSCVNPYHLFLGTKTDNMRDRDFKMRQAKGVRNGMAKLTESDVISIRRKAKTTTQLKLAKMFGVSRQLVGCIIRQEVWRHI